MDLPDDTSPYTSIHPRDKADVVDRLILAARNVAYDEKNVYWTGPICEKIILTNINNLLVLITVVYQNGSLQDDGIEVRTVSGGFQVKRFICTLE